MRAPLGRVGSYAPTVLNTLQCWGWATFELIIIAAAAAALSDELIGVGAQWFWTLVFGAVAASLALLGPVSVVRRFIRRYAVYVVLASLAYLTWWSLSEADLSQLWHAEPEGGLTLWIGMDLVIAITVSWVPLIPDYTRFSRDRRAAWWGAGLGYFVAATWMLVLGVLLVLTRGLSDPAELPAAVVGAGLAAALAVLAITVDEADEAFANIYSSAVSLQNLVPRVPQRALVVLVSVAATIGALAFDLRRYQDFLFLLGAFFVPLLGVLLAHWLLNGARYSRSDVFDAPAVRPALLAAWLLGFARLPVAPSRPAPAGGSTPWSRCVRRPAGSTRSASRSRASSRRSRSPRLRAGSAGEHARHVHDRDAGEEAAQDPPAGQPAGSARAQPAPDLDHDLERRARGRGEEQHAEHVVAHVAAEPGAEDRGRRRRSGPAARAGRTTPGARRSRLLRSRGLR